MVDCKTNDAMVDVGYFLSCEACPLKQKYNCPLWQKYNGWPKSAAPIAERVRSHEATGVGGVRGRTYVSEPQ